MWEINIDKQEFKLVGSESRTKFEVDINRKITFKFKLKNSILSKEFEEKLYKKLKDTLHESLGKPAFITTQQIKLYHLQDDIFIGSNSQIYTIHDKQPKQYNIFSLLSFIDKHTSKNLIKYTLYCFNKKEKLKRINFFEAKKLLLTKI